MNSQTVEITSAGIRRIFNKYAPERAIAEYVMTSTLKKKYIS